MRILLVEDNTDLTESIADYLVMQQHQCDFAYNGQSGLNLATSNQYDLYIFDVAMPKMDGLSLCRTLRNEQNDATPVLFLTARDTLEDKLAGFEAGADDYLIKPFQLAELHARAKALHKRHIGSSHRLKIHDLSVDLEKRLVTRSGKVISLSKYNFKLLVALLQRSPAVVPREELEYLVWGDDIPDSDSLRSHLYKLRNQIDKPFDKPLIHTLRGHGFKIE